MISYFSLLVNMGVYAKLISFDTLYANSPVTPYIVNDLPTTTKEDRNAIDRLTMTTYDRTDVFTNKPTCECGALTGGYNLGIVCYECNTPVQELFNQDLFPKVWLRAPNGVRPLMNPIMWNFLKSIFTKSKFNIIEYICNLDYQASVDRPISEIQEMFNLGVIRGGYNYFYDNFRFIIEQLCKIKHFSKSSKAEDLIKILDTYPDCIFSQYLPIPNKALLTKERTEVGPYIDQLIIPILDAVRTLQGIDTESVVTTTRQRENRAAKTIGKIAEYSEEVFSSILAKKHGLPRKHVYGTRCHWTVRAVISSNTKPHAYDELELGWSHGVTMFKTHLMNKLLNKHGMTANEATALLQEYTVKYSPFIDSLFDELFKETRYGYFSCIFVRNPTLGRASTQRMRITRIKKDPNDPTIGLSILSVNGYNAS